MSVTTEEPSDSEDNDPMSVETIAEEEYQEVSYLEAEEMVDDLMSYAAAENFFQEDKELFEKLIRVLWKNRLKKRSTQRALTSFFLKKTE